MHRFLWTLTAFFSAGAVALAIRWAAADAPSWSPSRDEGLRRGRAWTHVWPSDSGFRHLPDRFTVPLVVTLTDSPDSAARIVLHADGAPGRAPAAGVFVEASRTGLRLGRLEGGVAIERWSGGATAEDIPAGTPFEIVIRRRGADLVVTLDGRMVVHASESAPSGGRIAVAYSGGARARLGRVWRLPELPCFSDDFMRTQDEPGLWEARSGVWVIETLPTPSMSANGFSYRGRSEPSERSALALAGRASWDRYRFAASARGEAGEALGLVFAADGDGRYAMFRWTSREKVDGVWDPSTGRRELVLVEPPAGEGGGASAVERVLAGSAGGYIPEQWYRVEVELEFGRARVRVDGHELLSAGNPELVSGLVGLWSSGEKGATFDDVLVTPYRSIEDEFGSDFVGTPPAPTGPGPDWEALGGEWVIAGGGLHARTRTAEREAKLLTGSRGWRRFISRAGLAAPLDGEAGIVANYRDEGNYVLLRAEGKGRFSLERVRAGRRETLAAAVRGAYDGPEAGDLVLELKSDRGYLAGCVNGELLLEGRDAELLEGRTGLWVAGGRGEEGVRFRYFRSDLVPHSPPVNIVNMVFEADNRMSRWAGRTADWYETRVGSGRVAHWHRAPFYGDMELALDLPGGTPQDGRVVLGISKKPDHPRNGYGWELDFAPSGPEVEAEDAAPAGPAPVGGGLSGPHGKLWREGVTVDEVVLDSGHRLDSLFIRRQGRYVVAGAGGRALAHFIDPDPLPGGRIAYLVDNLDDGRLTGGDVKPSQARVYGGLFFDYLFTRAPVDWRSAAGLWEVTNRWECDTRWSWFVGRYDPESPTKAAVAWNKRSFAGDVLIDFYVGPMMEGRDRGKGRGQRYQYMRDMNVTIAADGRDIASGYTFTFAGFGNKVSAILRRDSIVAEDRSARALLQRNMQIHQKWHHVRVERKGSLLRYTVDFEGVRRVELSYDDPEPLDGDRIAVWTYDCGNVYARFRIAAGEGGALEDPDFVPPAVTHTFYDDETAGQVDDEAGAP